MTTHHTDEKKPPALVDRWNAWKEKREAKAREKALRDRGEWGYIPHTSMLMPRWFVVLLVATVSMNGLAVFSSRWVLEARLEQLAVAVDSSCAHPSQHPTPQKEK